MHTLPKNTHIQYILEEKYIKKEDLSWSNINNFVFLVTVAYSTMQHLKTRILYVCLNV